MSEHAGDVVPPRVSVDRAAGFIVAVLLRPGVEEVADLPRRVAGAAAVHLEDEREEARPGRGADRGRGRHMAVEARVRKNQKQLKKQKQIRVQLRRRKECNE